MVYLVCFLLPATEPQGWVVRHGDAAALYKFLLDDLKEEPTNGGLLQIRFKFKCFSYFLFFSNYLGCTMLWKNINDIFWFQP